jgi:hypothetical protein
MKPHAVHAATDSEEKDRIPPPLSRGRRALRCALLAAAVLSLLAGCRARPSAI